MILEESRWNYSQKAAFVKMEPIELEEDPGDLTEEDWNLWLHESGEEAAKMEREEKAVEAGWAALPFSPQLQPLSGGVFLAHSVSYTWPGFLPPGEDEEDEEDFCRVRKVVKLENQGGTWRLGGVFGPSFDDPSFTGDDTVVYDGLDSLRMLEETGELLLTRTTVMSGLIPGREGGQSRRNPDFRGKSYILYRSLATL